MGDAKIGSQPIIQPRVTVTHAPPTTKTAPTQTAPHAPDVHDVAKGQAFVSAGPVQSHLTSGAPTAAEKTQWKAEIAAAKTPEAQAALLSSGHFRNDPTVKKFVVDQMGTQDFGKIYDASKGDGHTTSDSRARSNFAEQWGPSLPAEAQGKLAQHISAKEGKAAARIVAPMLQAAGEQANNAKKPEDKTAADKKFATIANNLMHGEASVADLKGALYGPGEQALNRYSRDQLGAITREQNPAMVRASWKNLTQENQVELAQSLSRAIDANPADADWIRTSVAGPTVAGVRVGQALQKGPASPSAFHDAITTEQLARDKAGCGDKMMGSDFNQGTAAWVKNSSVAQESLKSAYLADRTPYERGHLNGGVEERFTAAAQIYLINGMPAP